MNQRRLHPVPIAMALLAAAPAWAMPPVPASAAGAAVAQAAAGAATRTFHAAGSVYVLANGLVVRATIAPVAVPAPGFVYER